MAFRVAAYAEHVPEEIGGQDLQYRARRDHLAVVQHDEVVAEPGGKVEVEVVQDGRGGDSGGADQVQELEPGRRPRR